MNNPNTAIGRKHSNNEISNNNNMKPQLSKPTPEASSMEVYVLSALFIDPFAVDRVADTLKPCHFYNSKNAAIYSAVEQLRIDGKPIDLLTVMEYLRRSGDLESIGGPAYLAEISSMLTSSANVEHHALVLIERWQRRELIVLSDVAQSASYDATVDVLDTLNKTAEKINDIIDVVVEKTSIEDQINEFARNAEKHYNNGGGLLGPELSGINQLDAILDGAHPGGVLVIAGEPGTGKSSLVNTSIHNLVTNGVPSVFWSGEMGVNRSLSRVIAADTRINSRVIFKGGYHNEEDYPGGTMKVHKFMEKIKDSGTVFLDGEMTLSRLTSVLAYYHRQGVRIFFFDRLELFSFAGLGQYGDEAKATIMGRIRSLATSLGIYIVILSQLRKSVGDNAGGRPTANDLLGTGAISQSATQIVFTYSPEKYKVHEDEHGNSTKDMVELIVEKNTDGEAGLSIPAYFNKELTLMSEHKVLTWKPNFVTPAFEVSEPAYTGRIETVNAPNDDVDIPF